jgi:thioredoxin reductase
MPQSNIPLDVTIVGGGPAGLSAALILGRCLREVLVIDMGNPRNAPAEVFNGFLSRDGSNPREFLQICRDQLRRYETVKLKKGKVVAADRDINRFTVTTDEGERITSRLLLLATGLVDELPEIEGLHQFYGKTAHSCPLCDAWEYRGKPMVVAGGSTEAANLALELLLWSKEVTLCSNGPLRSESKVREQISRCGIQVIETPIAKLEGPGHVLKGVRFVDGSFRPAGVLFFSPGQRQRSALAENLQCKFCDDGSIHCDARASTSVPGLFAAGNASQGVQLVIAAAAEGTLAGVAMNDMLVEADAETGALQRESRRDDVPTQDNTNRDSHSAVA